MKKSNQIRAEDQISITDRSWCFFNEYLILALGAGGIFMKLGELQYDLVMS